MPISTGAFSNLLNPRFRRVYLETGKERPLEYPMVFNMMDMEWNPETDLQFAGLGTAQSKPEGTQFPLDEPVSGGTKEYEADPFGIAFEITWEMFRDELYGIMDELAREQKRSMRHKQEVEAWSILNNAFNTSFVGFTAGEALCGNHTGLDGVVRRNRPTVDIEFSVTAIQNAVTRFENLTNEQNLPWVMAPTMFVIAPENKFVARQILGSTGNPFTTDNELNPIIAEDLSWMVSHYLTTSTYWFALAAKGIHDLNFRWRDQEIYDNFDDPWTKNGIFTGYMRFATGYGAWRGVDGSTGA